MNKPKKAVAMLRSANEDQEEQKAALDSQFEILMTYAKKSNMEIVDVVDNEMFCDGDTVLTDIQVVNDAYSLCESLTKVDYLIVADPTRISRNKKRYENWVELFKSKGIEIKAATMPDFDSDSAEAKLIESLSFSQ
jgi:DNA invertase Pin-like site-specific DNA recombinase